MVSLGTMFSSFWILANNSWMQVPVGHAVIDGKIVPSDWWAITPGPIILVRWPHMLLAAFLTTGMCVTATGAWYLLRGVHRAEARVMMRWGLGTGGGADPGAALLRPPDRRLRAQASAGEVRGHRGALEDAQPASEVLIAIPDEATETQPASRSRSRGSAASSPPATGSREVGLESFPPEDRPPVVIPFFGFRIMVGMGLIMLAVSWFGNLLRWRGRLETTRWFLWGPSSPSRPASSPS